MEYDYKVSSPGRVNIIGEHIDYCGGKVLPAALSLKNTVYVRANGTDKINIAWTTSDLKVSLDIDKLESYSDLKLGNYQAGCAFVRKNAGQKIIGCDMLQDCRVPFGSGLSSSAAIEVSTLAALAAVCGEVPDKKSTALLAQKTEREYVGVNCGIMDQYASAFGLKSNAIYLDCKRIEHEYVPIELNNYTLVVADCKKPHNLVQSKYNERRQETEEALSVLRDKTGANCLADVSVADFEAYKSLLSGKVKDRAEHVVYECERVKLAVNAMRRGDVVQLGELLNRSHESLKNLYEVTGDELDALAGIAQSFDGCVGSRMTGAGFGGSTVSIVEKSAVEDFKQYVGKAYKRKIGYAAAFYQSDIGDGITVEKL